MIIGLAGYAGAGKNTVADIICADYDHRDMAFANALKYECQMALNDHAIPAEAPPEIRKLFKADPAVNVYTKPTTEKARRILQWWGTDYRREQNPDYWINKVINLVNHDNNIVFTDVRYINEVKFIKFLGGEIWLVRRGTDKSDSHQSEMLPSTDYPWDNIIDNSNTVIELEKAVNVSMTSALKRWYNGKTNADRAGSQDQ